jgi:hypothetical protein
VAVTLLQVPFYDCGSNAIYTAASTQEVGLSDVSIFAVSHYVFYAASQSFPKGDTRVPYILILRGAKKRAITPTLSIAE